MPDLQTALQTALQTTLKQWEEPKEQTVQTAQTTQTQPRFAVSNNLCRATFEYVRDNPGQTNGEICTTMEGRGYKRTSVSSILSQMHHGGVIRRDVSGKYWATQSEYTPIKPSVVKAHRANAPMRKAKKAKVVRPVAQTRAMKHYLPKQEARVEGEQFAPVAPQPEVKICNSVEDLLNTLTVAQARELFDRLKKMFA